MAIGPSQALQLNVTGAAFGGDLFFVEELSGVDAIPAAGGTFDMIVRAASNGRRISMYWNTASTQDGSAAFFENPTTSDDGTEDFAVNVDRAKANLNVTAPGNQTFVNPTVTDPGTLLVLTPLDPNLESGNKDIAYGKAEELAIPVILAPGADYLIRITNDSVSAATGLIRVILQLVDIPG